MAGTKEHTPKLKFEGSAKELQNLPYMYIEEDSEKVLPDPMVPKVTGIRRVPHSNHPQIKDFVFETDRGVELHLAPNYEDTAGIHQIKEGDVLFITMRVDLFEGVKDSYPEQRRVTVLRNGRWIHTFGIRTEQVFLI